MEKNLDCRGLQCPQPVIRCREAIRDATPDKMIVVVDNLAAVENVNRFLFVCVCICVDMQPCLSLEAKHDE